MCYIALLGSVVISVLICVLVVTSAQTKLVKTLNLTVEYTFQLEAYI